MTSDASNDKKRSRNVTVAACTTIQDRVAAASPSVLLVLAGSGSQQVMVC